MSDKELIDEVMTLIVAGHETTAAALTWTWYLISQHRIPRRSCKPRRTARAPNGRLASTRRSRWQFTHQVMQEALRLYPPGWLFTRRTLEADELGGFAIGPRTDVFISPYMLHRHPDFWSEPEEFRPERFAGADAEERHQFAYIPFAVGPRHCIGENIAMFEMLVHVQHHVAPLSPDPRRQRAHRTRGADQSAPALQPHDEGRSSMNDATS